MVADADGGHDSDGSPADGAFHPRNAVPVQKPPSTARCSSPIPERRQLRKRRRRFLGLEIVEGGRSVAAPNGEPEDCAATPPSKAKHPRKRLTGWARGNLDQADTTSVRCGYRRLTEGQSRTFMKEETDAAETLRERLAAGFAEDYFMSPACARPLRPAQISRAFAAPLPTDVDQQMKAAIDVDAAILAHKAEWMLRLQLGFSLLFQGVGSKYRLLEAFADQALKPWGGVVVRINGFDARLSLAECLREVLDQVEPNAQRPGTSMESLLAAFQRVSARLLRPLCFIVHNLEVLPQPQQLTIACLAAMPRVHLIASVDSIWAPLAWTSKCLKDFNFVFEEVHTHGGFELEAAARYPRGLPAWCDPSADPQGARKASVGLVLRSLTNSHRELVQAMVEHQEGEGGPVGISTSKLLNIASDRMIVANVTKLRSLLTELKDHEVVTTRRAPDGSMLFYVPYSLDSLQCS